MNRKEQRTKEHCLYNEKQEVDGRLILFHRSRGGGDIEVLRSEINRFSLSKYLASFERLRKHVFVDIDSFGSRFSCPIKINFCSYQCYD